MEKTFGTRKGLLIGLIIWGAILLSFYFIGIPGIMILDPTQLILQPVLFTSVGFIWFGIRYKISDEYFSICLGPFTTFLVQTKHIESVKRSYNPMSAPAPSLKRLELKLYKRGFVLISPSSEDQFIRALKEVNPEIRIDLKKDPKNIFLKFWDRLL
jgi:hypothetical protein